MAGLDFAITLGGEIILGVLAFLISRSISEIDEDLKHLRASAHDIRDKLQEQAIRLAVLEERHSRTRS